MREKQRQWHKDKERQWTSEAEPDCIKRQQTALSSLQIQSLRHRVPCNSTSTSCLQRTSATECCEARGKQVLICYLCEKLQLNEGFTSCDQRWRGTRWLRILVASGYHYVMADPFLLVAMFSNSALINKLRAAFFLWKLRRAGKKKQKTDCNMESWNNGLSNLRDNRL